MKNKELIIKYISIFLLLFTYQHIQAGNEKRVKGLKGSEIITGAEIFLEDYRFQDMITNPAYTNVYFQEYAHVRVLLTDENNMLEHYSADWAVSVRYELKLTTEANITYTYAESVDIDYNQSTDYYDIMVKKYNTHNYHSATLKITGVTSSHPASLNSVRLDVELDIERTYVLDTADEPELSVKNSTQYGFSGPDKDDLELRWTPVRGAESYDLEWLFLDFPETPTGFNSSHYPIPGSAITTADLDINFNNATRLRLSGNQYTFTLNYPRGYILYRVRAVGKNQQGDWILGDWSPSATNANLNGSSPDKFIAYKGNSSPLNWQYTAVYAENGKRKELVSYLDGSLRTRQSLSVLNSDGNVVSNQAIYDREGREVVHVLPAVVSGSGLEYRQDLNKDSLGAHYSWLNFDQTSNLFSPEKISTTSVGAGKYYSPANTVSSVGENLIPDAQGYPFNRVILSNDGLNRPVRESGYGQTLKMGQEPNPEIIYLSPAGSEELDRVFGTEVGITGYTKQLRTDENEQIHIEYFDQDNRLIASTMVADFDANKNLLPLDSNVYPLKNLKTIKSDLLETANILTGITWESVNVVSPDINNTYHFNYTLASTNYNATVCDDPIFSTSPTVDYDLLLYIKDQNGNYVNLTVTIDGATLSGTHHTIDLNTDTVEIDFTAELELLNTYYITKKIVADSSAVNANVINQLNSVSFLCGWNLQEPNLIFGCVMSCMADQGYVPVYNAQGAVIHYKNQTDPTDLIALTDAAHYSCLQVIDCDSQTTFSEPSSICEIKKSLMIESMKTGGNYFENTADAGNINYDPEGWLTSNIPVMAQALPNSTLAFPGNDWALFKDAVETFESNGNSFIGTAFNTNIVNFFSTWTSDRWAQTLFRHHPEYDIYSCQCLPFTVEGSGGYYCSIAYETFDGFYHHFYDIEEDSIALAYGLFNPLGTQSTLNIPPADYLDVSPTTPLHLSEIWTNGFGLPTQQAYYRADSLLIYGAEFTSSSYPDVQLPMNEDGYISKVYNSLAQVTTLNGNPISVWDILAKSFEMSSTPGFTSAITATNITQNPYLNYLLGTGGPLHPNNLTPSARADYFRSQYYLYREMHWYDRIRTRANALVSGSNPYYFDQDSAHYPLMFPDNSIYNAILTGTDPMLAFQIDSLTDCTEQAGLWAKGIVESLRGTNPPGLYSDFNAYQTLIDQFPISTSSPDHATAINYINAESQLITDLTNAFISKSCNAYNSLPTSFLTTPITASAFNIQLSANAQNPESFVISPITGSASNDTLIAFDYPMSAVLNTNGTGPAYPHFTPDSLAVCGCENYAEYLVNNNLTASTDAQIAQQLLTDGIIGDTLDYTPFWKTYCQLSSNNVLDYLLASHFPEDFHCVPYPYLLAYNQDYLVAANQYETDYLQFQLDSIALYDTLSGYILDTVIQTSLENIEETFTMLQPPTRFHFTLYYYDQAGNLMKTVPPKGVASTYAFDEIDSLREGKLENHWPAHQYITNYKYNSLNQLTEKTTPDGGLTKYWYDELGRIILSQNAKQQVNNSYSYTLYDALSRTIESGQVISNTGFNPSRDLSTKPIVLNGTYALDYTLMSPFYIWLQMNRIDQRTQTNYDSPLNVLGLNSYFPQEDGGFGQENLRLRVSSITYKQDTVDGLLTSLYSSIDGIHDLITNEQNGQTVNIMPLLGTMQNADRVMTTYDHASHYTYDIHGNVSRLVQQSKDTHSALSNVVKSLDYTYDLISGNVNQVIYQKDNIDQFSHRYVYDADNRLQEVETSTDLTIWETQAKYFYYAHGPLARVELGDKQVQATDYAYTLQGWLKSVNAATLQLADDPGRDAQIAQANKHRSFAKDVFGYNLHYFDGDYTPTGPNNHHIVNYTSASLGNLEQYRNLYNGNITSMVTALQEAGVQSTRYTYDQLNRIKTSDTYSPTTADLSNYAGLDQANYSTKYKSKYIYDPNGNFLRVERKNEQSFIMDYIKYKYYNGSNRLKQARDAGANSASTAGTNDYQNDGYAFNSPMIFTYDEIGNLEADSLEEIEHIDWAVNGKVLSITRKTESEKPDLSFEYDGLGNRISKLVKPKHTDGSLKPEADWKKTVYIRDAQGNVMATYDGAYNAGHQLSDFHLYGSERLGLQQTTPDAQNAIQKRILGQKQYELKNHLGNVLSTVSDVKRSALNGNDVSYVAEIKSYSDYYPFGMQMPGRKFNGGDYRYGFNGMENDHEIKGDGNHLDFGARGYDPRLGRWQALDPLASKYPSMSPYNFVGNSPLLFVDPDGRKIVFSESASDEYKKKTLAHLQKLTNDKLEIKGNEVVVAKHSGANEGKNLEMGTELVSRVIDSEYTATLNEINDGMNSARPTTDDFQEGDVNVDFDAEKRILFVNNETGQSYGSLVDDENGSLSHEDVKGTEHIGLAHELLHASRMMGDTHMPSKTGVLGGEDDVKKTINNPDGDNLIGIKKKKITKEEMQTRVQENAIRSEQGLNKRHIGNEKYSSQYTEDAGKKSFMEKKK